MQNVNDNLKCKRHYPFGLSLSILSSVPPHTVVVETVAVLLLHSYIVLYLYRLHCFSLYLYIVVWGEG